MSVINVIIEGVNSGDDNLCVCRDRRDSSVIKEEIKAFLANRRISQAVVAQVTGERPPVCKGVGD